MLKKVLKGLGILLGVVVALLIGGYIYVEATCVRDYSRTPLPNIHASRDPEVIARGEYLANAVAHCSACHGPATSVSQHRLATDLKDLRGGANLEAGPFGTYRPANITQDRETGIGALSDGQIARAIRHGVDRHGHFAPLMALAVGNMADEDLTALVSYLRTVPAISNRVAADEWGFIAKALSSKFHPNNRPPLRYVAAGEASRERGEYLANGPAFCVGCHTPIDPMAGFAPAGPLFSGEAEPEPDPLDPNFVFTIPNLTPDPETGVMAHWDEDQFLARIRAGGAHRGSKMPWDNFGRMTDNDWRSIYRYLHSLPPTRHDTGASHRRVQ